MSALLAALLASAGAAPAMVVIDEAATVREEAPPHGRIGMSTAYRISDAVPAPRSFEFRKRARCTSAPRSASTQSAMTRFIMSCRAPASSIRTARRRR